MKNRIGSLLPLAASLLCLVSGCVSPNLLYEGKGDLSHSPLSARLIRLGTTVAPEDEDPNSQRGPVPALAFVNDTPDRVLSVRFAHRTLPMLRCSFTNGFSADEESTFTTEPLPPGAVVTICFHDKGLLEYEIHGLGDTVQVRSVVAGKAP